MARSTDLRAEASAMARIEAAFRSLDGLPEATKRRVLQYAADTAAEAMAEPEAPADAAT